MRSLSMRLLLLLGALMLGQPLDAAAVDAPDNYRLGAGDAIRVSVFQNPDMTVETRVSEDGTITFPLIRSAKVGGLDLDSAEKKIAAALEQGGFLKRPQVNIQLLAIRGNKVSVLGQVNRPGSYPLETFNTRLSQLLADAGGISAAGADQIIVSGTRDGKPYKKEIDIDALYHAATAAGDMVLVGGDTVYVPRAPTFFIYGEVARPGAYRVERAMTVRQAIAAGGGLTARGTERRLKVVHKTADGQTEKVPIELDDKVTSDDVIYVTESLF